MALHAFHQPDLHPALFSRLVPAVGVQQVYEGDGVVRYLMEITGTMCWPAIRPHLAQAGLSGNSIAKNVPPPLPPCCGGAKTAGLCRIFKLPPRALWHILYIATSGCIAVAGGTAAPCFAGPPPGLHLPGAGYKILFIESIALQLIQAVLTHKGGTALERLELDGCARPGGLALTQKALSLCGLPPGAPVLDIGCGAGATVRFLREGCGFDATGIDVLPGKAPWLLAGRAESLPFASGSLHAALFECSLSKMEDPNKALAECRRVLIEGGWLIVSDLYAKNGGAGGETGGGLESAGAIRARFAAAGFVEVLFEDETPALHSFWARLVFEMGPDAAKARVLDGLPGPLPEGCGYYLAVLRKCASSPVAAGVAAKMGGRQTTGEDQRRWQMAQLQTQLLYAQKNSSFYAALLQGAAIDRLETYEDLQSLPFTTPAQLAARGIEMLCVSQSDVARVATLSTSGTTGPPKRVWFTQNDLERTVAFFAVGMGSLAGPGQRVMICLSTPAANSIADLLARGLRRMGALPEIYGHLRDEQAAIAAEGAHCLVGTPAEMLYLCRKAPGLRPKTLLLSADYVPPAVLSAISGVWGCRVFTHYGLTETCYGGAVQCELLAGQHIRDDDWLFEIVDPETGAQLPFGARGEVVLTSLHNEAMPLVRYRTGDIASLAPAPCGCGGAFPTLGPVLGRRANLEAPLNIHRLDEIMFRIPGLCAYTAETDGQTLYLRVDGGPVDAARLEATLGRPVQITQGPLSPFTGGKRAIGQRRYDS